MPKNRNSSETPVHSVSLKVLGLSIDGKGLGGVIASPGYFADRMFWLEWTLGNGAAWLARLSAQSNGISETAPVTTGPKD